MKCTDVVSRADMDIIFAGENYIAGPVIVHVQKQFTAAIG